MTLIDSKRPSKLYYFSERNGLERSLSLGEFRLSPPAPDQALQAAGSYLVLSLTQTWDGTLFDDLPHVDSYLVVHNAEEFGERVHRAVQRALPNWAGIDAAISYGAPSPLGKIFSKAKNQAAENEWRFAWRPMQARASANPVVIQIGNIEDIAELHSRHD
ncbi:hypothetical protein [Herminiimonas arsenitoxidans]|uniref:hypothetical protein n=1 Tax=Herminiimonas arsenitoxidans TaxID=1809410 RepID=UPI0015714E2B|nr:hypothetical protein [Herminiimonas arsenitoxidans]